MEEPEFDETVDAIHHERPMRIICIGAGASGLCFAYKLQRSFRNFSLTVRALSPVSFHALEPLPLTYYARFTRRILVSLELGMKIHIQG